MTTSTITWHPVADQLPDDDMTVLLAYPDGDVITGWHDDAAWRATDGMPCEQPQWWADLPEPPA